MRVGPSRLGGSRARDIQRRDSVIAFVVAYRVVGGTANAVAGSVRDDVVVRRVLRNGIATDLNQDERVRFRAGPVADEDLVS